MCSHAHVHACAQMVENVTFYTVHTRTCAKRTKESEPLKTCVRGTGKTSKTIDFYQWSFLTYGLHQQEYHPTETR